MIDARKKKAKLNIIFALIAQVISLICGLIVPKLLIGSYGSEAYGATASISQFLAYISLLEGGVGGVARAALYKPLANKNNMEISAVISEIKRFFNVIAFAFLVYVLILACTFKSFSKVQCLDWISSFLLVFVISISTFAQYFIGISYSVLLQAAQQTYINQFISIVTIILNTLSTIVLIQLGCNLIIVKFVSSLVFALRPICLWLYVKKHYRLSYIKERNKNILEQKWTGLGQHIAFFLHSNTDIAVLTFFSNLFNVSIYSVYYMVVIQIQNFTMSFSSGMEALFGDMLTKGEYNPLQKTFNLYESLLSLVSGTLFSTAAIMIIPFVRLYTKNIQDVDYIYPYFALLLVFASHLYCLRLPYHAMIMAAGHFKQTRIGAYGEAIINICASVFLVIKYDLIGVAIGTVCAVGFRFLYYAFYLSKNIIFRDIRLFVKRILLNLTSFSLIVLLGTIALKYIDISNSAIWIICSVMVFFSSFCIQSAITFLFYQEYWHNILKKLTKRNN